MSCTDEAWVNMLVMLFVIDMQFAAAAATQWGLLLSNCWSNLYTVKRF